MGFLNIYIFKNKSRNGSHIQILYITVFFLIDKILIWNQIRLSKSITMRIYTHTTLKLKIRLD